MAETTAQWVEKICQQELPAITSTASLLDKFANDDKSSLPKLSKSILHDQALSSCVLKVANNVQHMSHTKVTTVSRATVVLGIHAVKNICITAKLLDGLFKSKNLSQPVYKRLTQLMANSFYAGLLAKMMVPDFDEDTQEEVYLAAMLYRIGETAFWSIGGEQCDELIKQVNLPKSQFEGACFQLLGTSFNELSKGLAKAWNLGELLEKSLDDPKSRTKEMQMIYLADKLSSYIGNPPDSMQAFNNVINEICALKKISVRQLKESIHQTRESALQLLNSYGASILEDAIKPLPTLEDIDKAKRATTASEMSKEKLELNAVSQLTRLTRTSKDPNDFLKITIQNLATIYHFDRCSFFMLTRDKKSVQARFSYNQQGETENFISKIDIVSSENIFAHVIAKSEAALIDDYKAPKWNNYITRSISELINDGTICLAPVLINTSTIGVILGQKHKDSLAIDDESFAQFSFMIEHLNMCLSMIMRK